MTKSRLEAFSDGVIAIIITIMVLEIKAPIGTDFENLKEILPELVSYILSFMFVLIYWNNHHHLFQAVKKINGKVLLANGFLLFWLSLIPFVTSWMGKNNFAPKPVMLFGFISLVCGIAWMILVSALKSAPGGNEELISAIGNNKKENISTVLYAFGSGISLLNPYFGLFIYFTVSVMWLIPDSRIEKVVE